jgi:hypothetical protein
MQRLTAAAGAATMVVGSAYIWAVNPTTVHWVPPCPLLTLTGFACPGCGLTRGFHALFHGDVVTALDFNALILLWAALFVYLFVSLVLKATRGWGLPWRFFTPRVLVGCLVLLISFGVLRNLPYYPFTILFP